MTIKAFIISLFSAKARPPRPAAYKTVDGHLVPYAEGQAALRSGQALLVGELLIGSYPVPDTDRI